MSKKIIQIRDYLPDGINDTDLSSFQRELTEEEIDELLNSCIGDDEDEFYRLILDKDGLIENDDCLSSENIAPPSAPSILSEEEK